MIKARGTIHGTDTMIIGLSAGNCRRLLAGEPIKFSGGELGYPGTQVVIVGGETEDDIMEDLRSVGLAPPKSPFPPSE